MAPLVFVAALGAALMGGVFFAFSSFIMPALHRIPPVEGMRAMQRINVDVFHWSFMGPFFAMPLLSGVVALLALRQGPSLAAALPVAGSVLYIAGCFMVTGLANVPRNKALARTPVDAPEAGRVWADYVTGWTRWNHVRTAACLGAAALFIAHLAWA